MMMKKLKIVMGMLRPYIPRKMMMKKLKIVMGMLRPYRIIKKQNEIKNEI
jgi:hypothetical protein